MGGKLAIPIVEGLIFLFREKRTSFFLSGGLGIGKVLNIDLPRAVAHIRIYRQSVGHPRIHVNHLPITVSALESSIKKAAGVQPGLLDGETVKLIREWERKFDEKLVAAFNESVFSARDYAIDSVGAESMKVENAAILSSYPVRGLDGRYTRVESLVGQILEQA